MESSYASSTGLESILTEADRTLRKNMADSDSSFVEENVIPTQKRAASRESSPKKGLKFSYEVLACLTLLFKQKINQ